MKNLIIKNKVVTMGVAFSAVLGSQGAFAQSQLPPPGDPPMEALDPYPEPAANANQQNGTGSHVSRVGEDDDVVSFPSGGDPGTQPASCDEAGETCVTQSGQTVDVSARYPGPQPTRKQWLHGFRLGTVYIFNIDKATGPNRTGSSLQERYQLESPWMFALGYEGMRRIVGHSWLNVILVANVTVVGLEQSKFIPTGNGLVGFELDESFQVGVGANLTPEEDKPLHMIAAIGWTPRVGSFAMPVHVTVVPDVDGNHRLGTTVGVNW